MNPSNIPSLIRSRSRSSYPSHQRHFENRGDVQQVEVVDNCGVGMPLFTELSNPNQLGVPRHKENQNGHRKMRSFSDFDRRMERRPNRQGMQAELDDMANVEVVDHGHHNINTCELDGAHINQHKPRHLHFSASDGELDQDREPDPATIFTTHQLQVPPDHRMRSNSRVSIRSRVRSRSRVHTASTAGDLGRHSTKESRTRYGSTNETTRNTDKACGGEWTPDQVDQLRRRVKFFFMDPLSKFQARKHIPWKLMLQFVKIVLITWQMIQFGGQRSEVVDFFERSQRAMQHLMLKKWDPAYETMPYPPATGEYALYTKDELFRNIDHAWEQYYNLPSHSVASVSLINDPGANATENMWMHASFSDYNAYPNGTYVVDSGQIEYQFELIPFHEGTPTRFDIVKFLENNNLTRPMFNKLISLDLFFRFNTFHLNLIKTHYGPTCYTVNATINYQNSGTGQVIIKLQTTEMQRECSGKVMSQSAREEEESNRNKNVVFDSGVIVVCLMSLTLCLRSCVRGWQLKRKVETLFRKRYGKKLMLSDRLEFINFWYFLIIINDICTIIGAAFKIQLEFRLVPITSVNYDACSFTLGLGGLLAWIGCLRYLGFFKEYNILILTLKQAFPNILRFMVCALLLYFGFMFCGWLILSPYHLKFRQLSTASECLFALVNGDDMYVTFSATVTDNQLIWYFSRAYLYIFVSLFIYCVLSLFIAVIMDVYETLKDCYEHGFPKSELHRFIEQCNDPLQSGLYRRQHTENETAKDWSFVEFVTSIFKRRKGSRELNERAQLIDASSA